MKLRHPGRAAAAARSRDPIRTAARAFGVVSCFFVAVVIISQVRFLEPPFDIIPEFAEPGETLIHNLHPPARLVSSFYLPLKSIGTALLYGHHGGALESFFRFDVGLGVVLILALCTVIAPIQSLMATLALIISNEAYVPKLPELFPRMILLVAFFLVWRAQAPSSRRTLFLGAAIGATLLYRSTLAFFPPVLAFFEWACRRSEVRWKLLFFLCVVPYLFLIPWIAMNAAVHQRFIPFEMGGASSNIVSGALGLTETMEGELAALFDKPIDAARVETVLGWAIHEIVRHPLRYVLGVFARIRLVFSYHPVLFLLAAVGACLGFKRSDIRQLTLLSLYFVLIHCVMTIERRYFDPLWPVLAVLAASPMAYLWKNERSRTLSYRISETTAIAVLGLVLVLCAYTGWVASSYAVAALRERPGYLESLDRELAAHPADPWLWFERGKERLNRDEMRGAASDFSKAQSLRPGYPAYYLELAWVKTLLGDPAPLLNWETLAEREGHGRDFIDRNAGLNLKGRFYKAYASMRLGQRPQAHEHLLAAKKIYDSMILVRGRHGQDEAEVLERLRAQGDRTFFRASENFLDLDRRPLRERLDFLDLLSMLVPPEPEFWVQRAQLALNLGEKSAVLESLRKAEALRPGDAVFKALATLRGRSVDLRRKLEILDLLIENRPMDAELRLDYAEAALELGQGDRVLRSLQRTQRLRMGRSGLERMAALYGRCLINERIALGRQAGPRDSLDFSRRGADLLDFLVKRGAADAGLILAQANLAADLNQQAYAIKTLQNIPKVDLTPALRIEAAFLCSRLGRFAEALALFGRVAEASRSVRVRLEQAKAAAALGREEFALRALDGARRLGLSRPEQHAAAMVYQTLGRYLQAIEILESLLKAAPEREKPALLHDRAVCGQMSGAPGKALEDLQNALRLKPDWLAPYLTLGAVLVGQGRCADALAAYGRALDIPKPSGGEALRQALIAARGYLLERCPPKP